MNRRWITPPAFLAALLLIQSCSSGVVVRRQDPLLAPPVNNVAVLLFYQEVEDAPEHLAELATDAFTLEVSKYFPAVVDRYQVRDFLRRKGYKSALTPRVLQELGSEFGVDALFVGKITGYSEKKSFLGWNGKPNFQMSCRLLSVQSGRPLIDGQADMEGSCVVPVETNQDRVVYGVRMLTQRMGLKERFGMMYITRDDPLWIQAMTHYERKRFWDAANTFGLIVHHFGRSDLRDEAQFYLGRSLEELRLERAAREVYTRTVDGPFAGRALLRRMEIAWHEGAYNEVISLAGRMADHWKGDAEAGCADYLAGLSLLCGGRSDEGIARLRRVSESSRWYGFARYAAAAPLFEKGDDDAGQASLIEAARATALTESERRLRGQALVALGDYHHTMGDREGAVAWYEEVEGYFRPRALLGLAWIAAEQGDYEDAIAQVDRMEGDVPPRWTGEAELLAGTCEARLSRLDRSADRLETALGTCAEWKKESAEQREMIAEFTALCDQLESDIGPMEPEIVSLLLGAQNEEDRERLDSIRRHHETVTRNIPFLERRAGPDVEGRDEETVRERIRERAEFSLVQVRYEQERSELSAAPDRGGSR